MKEKMTKKAQDSRDKKGLLIQFGLANLDLPDDLQLDEEVNEVSEGRLSFFLIALTFGCIREAFI